MSKSALCRVVMVAFGLTIAGCSGSSAPATDGGTNLCTHCGSQPCCNGVCVDTNTDPNNCGQCGNACMAGPAPDCVMGKCGCAAIGGAACGDTDTCCANGCKNLKTDQYNCGTCGNRCTGNQTCNNGVCSCGGVTCQGTQICCTNQCVDPKTDPNNCGFCGNKCTGSCVNGTCSGGV